MATRLVECFNARPQLSQPNRIGVTRDSFAKVVAEALADGSHPSPNAGVVPRIDKACRMVATSCCWGDAEGAMTSLLQFMTGIPIVSAVMFARGVGFGSEGNVPDAFVIMMGEHAHAVIRENVYPLDGIAEALLMRKGKEGAGTTVAASIFRRVAETQVAAAAARNSTSEDKEGRKGTDPRESLPRVLAADKHGRACFCGKVFQKGFGRGLLEHMVKVHTTMIHEPLFEYALDKGCAGRCHKCGKIGEWNKARGELHDHTCLETPSATVSPSATRAAPSPEGPSRLAGQHNEEDRGGVCLHWGFDQGVQAATGRHRQRPQG